MRFFFGARSLGYAGVRASALRGSEFGSPKVLPVTFMELWKALKRTTIDRSRDRGIRSRSRLAPVGLGTTDNFSGQSQLEPGYSLSSAFLRPLKLPT